MEMIGVESKGDRTINDGKWFEKAKAESWNFFFVFCLFIFSIALMARELGELHVL